MSQDSLRGAIERLVALEARVTDVRERQALAEDLQRSCNFFECMHCGSDAAVRIGLCDECEAADKCEDCKCPCPEGYFDSENSLCESCSWDATREEREAVQKEFEARDRYGDELRDRIKDERRPTDARIRALLQ